MPNIIQSKISWIPWMCFFLTVYVVKVYNMAIAPFQFYTECYIQFVPRYYALFRNCLYCKSIENGFILL